MYWKFVINQFSNDKYWTLIAYYDCKKKSWTKYKSCLVNIIINCINVYTKIIEYKITKQIQFLTSIYFIKVNTGTNKTHFLHSSGISIASKYQLGLWLFLPILLSEWIFENDNFIMPQGSPVVTFLVKFLLVVGRILVLVSRFS